MSRLMALMAALLISGLGSAWAQHGHAVGAAGGHGAPPQFSHAGGNPTMAAPPANVSARVAANPVLTTKVQPLLPAGMTLQTASAGFKNQGQFLAALHVSKNLNIPFSQLQTDMTGASHDSLGKAIQDLRPNLSDQTVKSNVKLAHMQAKQDERTATSGAHANIAARISGITRLATRVNALLPAGTSLQAATAGFRNEGQFLAALHLSRTLGIPFAQLQTEVVAGRTLGQAVTDLRPSLAPATVQADVKTAGHQARRDMGE
jgi:hypothetical protein